MRWYGWVLAWLLPLLAAAAPDGVTHHMQRWTQAQGAPLAAYGLAQTQDGLLWFATTSGLVEFDGVRFRRRHTVHGHRLPFNNVLRVAAVGDRLLVGYQTGGVSVIGPRGARDYRPGEAGLPEGSIAGFAVERDGTIHVATSRGTARLAGGRWEAQAGFPANASITYFKLDRDGTFWAIGTGVYARPRHATAFSRMLDSGAAALAAGGRVTIPAPGGGFLELDGAGRHRLIPVEQAGRFPEPLFSGAGGTLWTSRVDGVFRLARGADGKLRVAESFDGAGDTARDVIGSMVDREGNLWVTSRSGVERYRPHRLHGEMLPDEMSQFHVQAAPGGEMWVGGRTGVLQRLAADGSRRTLPFYEVSAMHRAAPDRLWAGNRERLCVAGERSHECWPLPPGLQGNDVQAIASDRAGRVWVSIVRHGLFRFDAGRWVHDGGLAGMPALTPVSMLTGPSGRTWIGYTEGRIGELGERGIRMLPAAAGAVGNVLAMHEHAGRLLAGGDNGIAWLDGDTARPLRPARGDAFRGVAGILTDRNGDLWLHGTGGLFHVTAAQLAAFFRNPSHPVESEVFDFADGLLGQVAQLRPLPSLALGHDGRIWYATASQVGWIDPAAIPRNPLPPTVLIRGLRTPGGDYAAADGLELPERTTELDIAFAATAMAIPERVRLRYRLHGVDADWREVEQERQAHYTNLGPGSYRFDVIAANEDGVWSPKGATLAFTIAPTVWQTGWFRALCVAMLALAAWLAYRWRLAAATRLVSERAAARIDERERIARSLHDNLLQGVHGLVLQCQAAAMQLPGDAPAARSLDKALADADALVAHTRDEVMALRDEAAPGELLADVCARVAALEPAAAGNLRVETAGHAVPLRGEAAVEIAHVLREAALNSCRHAQAGRIVVALRFGARSLEGSVRDDGRGIDPDTARQGRAGHWGIVGMRERIARLGGTLDIAAGRHGGTVVRFRIPAHAAYRAGGPRARSFIARAVRHLRTLHGDERKL